MPVHFLASAVSSAVPTEYWASLAASFIAISFLKTWSKGAKVLDPPPPVLPSSSFSPIPPLPQDLFIGLHGRIILVASGAFTPLGVVTISALVHRGAQIIALTPDISSPDVIQLIHLIRDSTQSELVYAEQCDIGSLESISAFAALWNSGDKKQPEGVRRLDGLLFLPPTRDQVDRVQLPTDSGQKERRRDAIYQLHVLSRFHLINSLLRSLLVLPREREIRIVSVMSPFYAAGLTHFDVLPPSASSKKASTTGQKLDKMAESSYSALIGAASLRWYALTLELQRRLDLLAEADPRPRTKLPGIDVQHVKTAAAATGNSKGGETVQEKAAQKMKQHSNINIINVCSGFERTTDIIDTFLPHPSRLSPPSSSSPTASQPLPEKGNPSKTASILESELASRPIPVRTANPISMLIFYIKTLLRWCLLLLVWPVLWLLSKSPATAADSVVWATTRKVEPLTARYNRILASLSSSGEEEGKEPEVRRWQDGIIPGEMYREGRIIRPQLPPRFGTSRQGGEAWGKLWKAEEEEVERRVKALGGSIKRPKI
ncbi:uncharacterized protein UDID_04894 [Ustilago sp. UG-2017a]|nr:uncharacterized protein UDID_04894 [Ustilago sp. UG-2017a]